LTGNIPPGKLPGALGALEGFLARVASLMPRKMLQTVESSIAGWTDVYALVLVVLGGVRGGGHGGCGGDGGMWITCNFDHQIVRSHVFGTRDRNRRYV
jgi:hypothetical protein